jgi:hypothetical protein
MQRLIYEYLVPSLIIVHFTRRHFQLTVGFKKQHLDQRYA